MKTTIFGLNILFIFSMFVALFLLLEDSNNIMLQSYIGMILFILVLLNTSNRNEE